MEHVFPTLETLTSFFLLSYFLPEIDLGDDKTYSLNFISLCYHVSCVTLDYI